MTSPWADLLVGEINVTTIYIYRETEGDTERKRERGRGGEGNKNCVLSITDM